MRLEKMTKRIESDKPKPPYDAAARKAQKEERATEGAKAMTEYKAEGEAEPTAGQRGGGHHNQKKVACPTNGMLMTSSPINDPGHRRRRADEIRALA
jgi:uncharacterized protein YkwD